MGALGGRLLVKGTKGFEAREARFDSRLTKTARDSS